MFRVVRACVTIVSVPLLYYSLSSLHDVAETYFLFLLKLPVVNSLQEILSLHIPKAQQTQKIELLTHINIQQEILQSRHANTLLL